jgi:SOS-response transcriptional repressor LexA
MAGVTFLEEAVRLIKEGKSVTFKANGRSMLPFIKGGEDLIVLVQTNSLQVGDIVLARVDDNRYVIHRVIKIHGQKVTLMGDGNLYEREQCQSKDVIARADYVIKPDGQQQYLYTTSRKWMGRLWYWLFPIRRYLLAIYRRV